MGKHRRKIVLLIFGLLLLGACQSNSSVPYVNLQTDQQRAVAGEERAPGRLPLRVAVAAVLSPQATFETYEPFLDTLSRRLNRPVELLQRPTYAEINELIRTGQADIAFVCGGAFVEGERENYMELLVAPQVKGKITYRALVIVPAASKAHAFEDLRGGKFAFTDPLSNSGRLYVTWLLRQQGETPESFFDETIFTYSHDNSVRAVAEGIVDAASVDSLVYNYLIAQEPELAGRTRVILTSPEFGIPPVVVHKNLNPALKEELRRALIQMADDEQGHQALSALHVERFTTVDATLYDGIREMAAPLRGWATAQGSP